MTLYNKQKIANALKNYAFYVFAATMQNFFSALRVARRVR